MHLKSWRAPLEAERPLIATSYCGRSARGFEALKVLLELLCILVHENVPIYNNFSTTTFLHQRHQCNSAGQLPALAEADGVGLNESTTNLGNVADHLRHDRSLSLIGSGGGSLGLYSGAAVGASLALKASGRSTELAVAFTGDGRYFFSVPSCAY